jgi:hypothetical protein
MNWHSNQTLSSTLCVLLVAMYQSNEQLISDLFQLTTKQQRDSFQNDQHKILMKRNTFFGIPTKNHNKVV